MLRQVLCVLIFFISCESQYTAYYGHKNGYENEYSIPEQYLSYKNYGRLNSYKNGGYSNKKYSSTCQDKCYVTDENENNICIDNELTDSADGILLLVESISETYHQENTRETIISDAFTRASTAQQDIWSHVDTRKANLESSEVSKNDDDINIAVIGKNDEKIFMLSFETSIKIRLRIRNERLLNSCEDTIDIGKRQIRPPTTEAPTTTTTPPPCDDGQKILTQDGHLKSIVFSHEVTYNPCTKVVKWTADIRSKSVQDEKLVQQLADFIFPDGGISDQVGEAIAIGKEYVTNRLPVPKRVYELLGCAFKCEISQPYGRRYR